METMAIELYGNQLVKHKDGSYHFHLLSIVLLLFFIGLRYQVGGDWASYSWHYDRAATEKFPYYIELNELGYAV